MRSYQLPMWALRCALIGSSEGMLFHSAGLSMNSSISSSNTLISFETSTKSAQLNASYQQPPWLTIILCTHFLKTLRWSSAATSAFAFRSRDPQG